MPSRHLGNNRTRRDCLGHDPTLLLITPIPAASYTGHFRSAPNEIRVVINVVHNVHTISNRPRSCTIRTRSAMWDQGTVYL